MRVGTVYRQVFFNFVQSPPMKNAPLENDLPIAIKAGVKKFLK
jgi:hypothetical protein